MYDLLSFIYMLFHSGRQQFPKEVWKDDWAKKVYKRYERVIQKIAPAKTTPDNISELHHLLSLRYSPPSFPNNQSVEPEELATLLTFLIGQNERGTRLIPSAGGFYPIETYLLLREKEYLHLYHFDVGDGSLRMIRKVPLSRAALLPEYQPFLAENVSGMFIFTANIKRSFLKYGFLAIRQAFTEAGIIAQTITLGLVSTGYVSKFFSYSNVYLDSIIGVEGEGEYGVLTLLFSKK